MKKSFLLVGILSISTIFADSIEKNGVNFQWEHFGGRIYFINNGRPYSLKIMNNSSHAIEVSKSVISAPLIPYQEIQRISQKRMRALFAASIVWPAMISFLMVKKTISLDFLIRFPLLTYKKLLTPIFVGGIGAIASSLAYKLLKLDSLKQQLLDAPITIQPGQTVTKIFWLQNPGQLVASKWGILSNPKGQFSIDFDAIKVLK